MTDEQKQSFKQAFNQRIGLKISELRKKKGLTQEQLSEIAGLQRTHVGRIEAGKYEVTGWVLQAIAEALGMTLDIVKKGRKRTR